MGTEHIGRLARLSLGAGSVGIIIALLLEAPTWAAGIGVGTLWGVANLLVLRFLIVRWIRPRDEKRRDPRLGGVAVGLLLKFPILYGVGYLLLRSDWFRIEALVIGFIVPFAVAFVDALGRVLADGRAARRAEAEPQAVTAGTKLESGC
jgi:hypothetical protein